jgi:uncharacterized protein (TIGR02421 family)
MGTVPFVGGHHARVRLLTSYETRVRHLSDRLAQARRPLRVLDAVRWDDDVERAFFAAGGLKPPPVTPAYYAARPLGFDPDAKRREFRALERDVRRTLGPSDPAGQLLTRRCHEYREVVDLLALRGTPGFGPLSGRLYGGAGDRPHAGGPTLAEIGGALASEVRCRAPAAGDARESETLAAGDAAAALAARLGDFFGDRAAVCVRLAAGMVADAAAGGRALKVRRDARFTLRELRLLEVHEGWVHLGTTLNARGQSVCTFLEHGPPSATATQEGLAVLTELLTLAASPARVCRLAHRVAGVARAEAGAGFLEVYRFFLAEGYGPRESYQNAARIFRGSLPSGCGPFTKDLCYVRGFLLVHDFARAAVRGGDGRLLPLLFCGKTALADLPALARLADEGLVAAPSFLPPPFADLDAAAAWFRAATALERLPLRPAGDDGRACG